MSGADVEQQDAEPVYVPAKYRKKPVVVEAVQLCWANWNAVCQFVGDAISEETPGREVEGFSDMVGEIGPYYIEIDVTTIHGEKAVVRHGDWIVAEPVAGRFYPVKPDIFAASYEPA